MNSFFKSEAILHLLLSYLFVSFLVFILFLFCFRTSKVPSLGDLIGNIYAILFWDFGSSLVGILFKFGVISLSCLIFKGFRLISYFYTIYGLRLSYLGKHYFWASVVTF